jgi:putative transposase
MKFNYNFQPKNFRSKQGWYRRGYLPHFDGGETAQFITFRLFDSLPQEILEKWRAEIFDEKGEIEFRKKVESYLDS